MRFVIVQSRKGLDMAKGIKTGGRKPGTLNRATAAKVAEIAASGQTPLDFMLSVMRNEECTPERRLEAAKAAAPFIHPRLAAVEHSGSVAETVKVEMSDIDVARRIAFLLARAKHNLDSGTGIATQTNAHLPLAKG